MKQRHLQKNIRSAVHILCAFLLFFNSMARAQQLPGVPQLSRQERYQLELRRWNYHIAQIRKSEIYQDVRAYCHGNDPLFALKYTMASMGQVLEIPSLNLINTAKDLYRNKGLSNKLTTLLNSEAYYVALEDCFPDDDLEGLRSAQGWITTSLILQDLFGKLLIGSGIALAFENKKALLTYKSNAMARLAPITARFPLAVKGLHYAGLAMPFMPLMAPMVKTIEEKFFSKSQSEDKHENPRTDIIQRMNGLIYNALYLLEYEILNAQSEERRQELHLAKIDLLTATVGWEEIANSAEGGIKKWEKAKVQRTRFLAIQQLDMLNGLISDLQGVQKALEDRRDKATRSALPLVSGTLLTLTMFLVGQEQMALDAGSKVVKVGASVLASRLGAAAIGVSVGKYSASLWYKLKEEEINMYLAESGRATQRLEAIDRALHTVLRR